MSVKNEHRVWHVEYAWHFRQMRLLKKRSRLGPQQFVSLCAKLQTNGASTNIALLEGVL